MFEPMKLCGPSVICLPAGAALPESSITVMNGSKSKVVKALIAGKRHHLEVVSKHISMLACWGVQQPSSACILLVAM